MNKKIVCLDDLIEAKVLEKLGLRPEDITNREDIVEEANPHHHSLSGTIKLISPDNKEKKLFFKKYGLSQTETASSSDSIELLQQRETIYLNLISKINSTLVSSLLGSLAKPSENKFFLFDKYLSGKSAKEKFLEIAQKIQTSVDEEKAQHEKERLTLIREGFRQIARFNGLCHTNKTQFTAIEHLMSDAYQKKQDLQAERLLQYLLRTIHYSKMGGREYWESDGKEGEKFDEEKVKEHLKKENNLDLSKRVAEVFKLREDINFEKRLQHGDCQLQHNFEGIFCDLEDFGYYPWQYDIVTYSGEEIASPPVDELPGLLAYYLVYERAYGSKSHDFTLNEVKKLDEEDPHDIKKLLSERIEPDQFADFTIGYIACILEDDIIKNGIRKKYSKEDLKSMTGNYPGYSLKALQSSRLKHIEGIYHFITSVEAGSLFSQCTNQKGVIAYFFNLGRLLNDLDLVKIEHLENLEKCNGSQWDLFFGKKS